MTASERTYTAEFKDEAVRLVISSQKRCAEIARNLGIEPHLMGRWKQHHEQETAAGRPQFTGRGAAALNEQEARFKKLERELEMTRREIPSWTSSQLRFLAAGWPQAAAPLANRKRHVSTRRR